LLNIILFSAFFVLDLFLQQNPFFLAALLEQQSTFRQCAVVPGSASAEVLRILWEADVLEMHVPTDEIAALSPNK